jgi:hypothetical protein
VVSQAMVFEWKLHTATLENRYRRVNVGIETVNAGNGLSKLPEFAGYPRSV